VLMAQSKQAVPRPSSAEIHDRLTMGIISGTLVVAPSPRAEKYSPVRNLAGCCKSDTVARYFAASRAGSIEGCSALPIRLRRR
jgi:hypothetical protein